MGRSTVLILLLFVLVYSPCSAQSRRTEKTKEPDVCPVCTDFSGKIQYEGCMIKGNINRKGDHIYHCPLWRDYDKTVIDKEEGERWFCTEDEARAAGWREPKYQTGSCR